MTDQPGLGRTEYLRYCQLLGLAPNEAASPLQRAAALPSWLGPELIATEPARAKLRAWAALRRPPPSRRTLDRDLIVLGLDPVRPTLVAAVRRMPPPVQHHLLFHVWIVGSTRRLAGWTWQAPPYPAGPLQLLVVDGKLSTPDLLSVFAHEVSHAWLLPVSPPDRVKTIRERTLAAGFGKKLAARWRRPDLLMNEIERDRRVIQRDEAQAIALAQSWGFPQVDRFMEV